MKSAFEWRNQFKQHPMAMLSLAVGGGVLVAALIPVGRRKHYVDRDWVRKNARMAAERVSSVINGKPAYNSFDLLKGAAMTVAASRFGGIIGDLIAGYRDELRRTKLSQRHAEW